MSKHLWLLDAVVKKANNTRASNSNTVEILKNICYGPVLNTYPVKHRSYIKIILKLRWHLRQYLIYQQVWVALLLYLFTAIPTYRKIFLACILVLWHSYHFQLLWHLRLVFPEGWRLTEQQTPATSTSKRALGRKRPKDSSLAKQAWTLKELFFLVSGNKRMLRWMTVHNNSLQQAKGII